jgi:transmembrane sensor
MSSIRQKTAGPGPSSILTLPDSSKVRLTAGSKLLFPPAFGTTGHREVFLEGEAFFNIAPGVSAPFLVYTRSAIVKALGSSFNVNATGPRTTVSAIGAGTTVSIIASNEYK